jgi:hypothetical protein
MDVTDRLRRYSRKALVADVCSVEQPFMQHTVTEKATWGGADGDQAGGRASACY